MNKQEVMAKVALTEKDTGSPEVQVALLTARHFLVQECNPNPNHFPRMQLPSLLQKSRSVSLLYS